MDNEYRFHFPAALRFQSSVDGRFGGIWSPSLCCEGDMCIAPARNQTPILRYQFGHGTQKIRKGGSTWKWDTKVELYRCSSIRHLALTVKHTNPDFYRCMKMIVGWLSMYCLCGAESGMCLHWGNRQLILQVGSQIRTYRKGTNLVGAESCIAFSESVEDVAKVR
jgi:hypothetical protein